MLHYDNVSIAPPVLDAPPGETGRRITEEGLLTNFPGRQKGPAVLTLSGSTASVRQRRLARSAGVSLLLPIARTELTK